MTASPITAEPVPGAGEIPPAGTADGLEEDSPRKRRRKLLLLLFLLAGLLVLLGLAIWYLLFRQPIPLPVIPGETIMPGYSTSIYAASRPMSVAVNGSGDRIYVGETAGDQTARILDAGGNQLATLVPPASTGTEHVPVYVALNPVSGEVYVSDRPTASIYVYDAAGTYLRAVTPPADAEGWQPLGLAFDPAGNLYVTDSNNGRLLVFAEDGSIVARVGRGVGEGNLGLPRGVALDGQGRVYVVDSTGHTVFVYGRYVEGSQRLEYLGSFGSQGSADGTFAFPNGIAVDGRGRLYVADSANDRVQLWSY